MVESTPTVAPKKLSESIDLDRLIHYEPRELEAKVKKLLDELQQLVTTPPGAELLGPEIACHVAETGRNIATRLVTSLRIAVIGEFKRGKSSLINAMLKEPLLAVDVTPETMAITQVCYGETKHARLRLKDGGRIELTFNELKRERLEPVLERLGDCLKHVEVQAPVEELETINWVDTPGAGDLFRQFDDQVASYLAEADVVVIVVSPLAPLSNSEIVFLTQALARHDFPKVYAVLNMIDLVREPDDRARVISQVRERLSETFPGVQLFALSAVEELTRLGHGERRLPEATSELDAAFAAFRASIEELAKVRGDVIRAQRSLDLTKRLLAALVGRIGLIRAGLEAKSGRLEETVAAHEARQADLAEEMNRNRNLLEARTQALIAEAKVWLRSFTTRLIGEVSKQAMGIPLERLERHLPFFLTDTLRQALSACIDAHRPELEALIAERLMAVTDELRPLADSTELARLGTKATFGEPDWDDMHLVGLVADRFFIGAGLVVDALGSLVGGPGDADEKAVLSRLQGRQAELDSALSEIVERSYGGLHELLETEFETARATQGQAIGEALHQAQALASQHNMEQAERAKELDWLAEQLSEHQEKIASLHRKLIGS